MECWKNIPIPLKEVLALLLIGHLATFTVELFLLDVLLVIRVVFVVHWGRSTLLATTLGGVVGFTLGTGGLFAVSSTLLSSGTSALVLLTLTRLREVTSICRSNTVDGALGVTTAVIGANWLYGHMTSVR